MEWVAFALLSVAVVAVAALMATGRLTPDLLSEPTTSVPPLDLPVEPSSGDVAGLRLGTAAYGYAPADVDAALEARRDRLARQEQLIKDRDGHVHPGA